MVTSSPASTLQYSERLSQDFAGKDNAAARNNLVAIIDSLTAAKGYEQWGVVYNSDRAYALDRAAKCLDFAVPLRQKTKSFFLLYAQLKEQAGELFLEEAEFTERLYEDAGYGFLRAAFGYARAGEVQKAEELQRKSYQAFKSAGLRQPRFRGRILNVIRSAKQTSRSDL